MNPDVEDGVAHSGDEERNQCERCSRPRTDEQQWQAPAGKRDREDPRESGPTIDAKSSERTHEAAEAERRAQETNTGVAQPEELDRSDHDQREEQPTNEGLHEESPATSAAPG